MAKVDIENIYGKVIGTFGKYELDITKAIYPQIEEVSHSQPRQVSPVLLDNFGSPSSVLLKLNIIPEGKTNSYSFIVRCYGDVPSTYEGKSDPWKKDETNYAFLREAGIRSIPKSFLPNSSKLLFLEYLHGQTLLQKMEDSSLEEQIKILEHILGPLTDFQRRATQHCLESELSEYMKDKLFSSRNMKDKAREYFSKISGKEPKKVNEDLIKAYGLIAKAHRGNCVCHGDLGPRNIIINGDGIFFIDPELELGDSLNDLGSLFAYLGMYFPKIENYWTELGTKFRKSKLEEIVKGSFDLSEDEMINVLFKLSASILHKSFKILAKNQITGIYTKEQEGRLRKQIGAILGRWIANPDEFALGPEDVEAARILMANYELPRLTKTYDGPERIVADIVT